jgi:hypothetical protein
VVINRARRKQAVREAMKGDLLTPIHPELQESRPKKRNRAQQNPRRNGVVKEGQPKN